VLVLALVAAVGCSSGGDDDATPKSTPASVTVARLDPHPTSAISAVLHVETAAASVVSATVEGPGGSFEIPADDRATTHDIPVVGMRAQSKYTVTAHAASVRGGPATDRPIELTTGALPASLPPMKVTTSDAARMAPGYTVFNVMPFTPTPKGQPPADAGIIVVVDPSGAVVWYDILPFQILDIDTTPRGTFLVTAGDSLIQEVDVLGKVVREWGSRIATDSPGKDVGGRTLSSNATKKIDVDSAHHEVTELPNGDIITLSTEVLEIPHADAERLCPKNPETSVVGDLVVELAPDGKVVQRWPISAVYDPTKKPGPEMCIVGQAVAPPNWFYPASHGTRDWTHANAVVVDEEDNTLIVSLRNLDQVIGLRYHDDDEGKAGELLWSLGVDGTIDLEQGAPAHHQHAVELEKDGSLLMYDNGNMRPGTTLAGGTEAPYSRAVRYDVDLAAGTAKQVWEHRDTWPDGRPIYTPFLGDVDLEPNGDVLITHGGGSSTTGSMLGRILEVVPGDAADGSADETVFDMTVGDGTTTGGWTLYRAERLPSLYFRK
jgi:hypothetical protein